MPTYFGFVKKLEKKFSGFVATGKKGTLKRNRQIFCFVNFVRVNPNKVDLYKRENFRHYVGNGDEHEVSVH